MFAVIVEFFLSFCNANSIIEFSTFAANPSFLLLTSILILFVPSVIVITSSLHSKYNSVSSPTILYLFFYTFVPSNLLPSTSNTND